MAVASLGGQTQIRRRFQMRGPAVAAQLKKTYWAGRMTEMTARSGVKYFIATSLIPSSVTLS